MASQKDFVAVSGMAFIEYSGSRPNLLTSLFDQMGLSKVGNIPETPIELYNSGEIYFISNPTCGGNAELFRSVHVRGASAMGFRVEDSAKALEIALSNGASEAAVTDYDIPAIKGVGQSIIYLVDAEHEKALFKQFGHNPADAKVESSNLQRVDHVTHNLNKGGVARMCKFYETIFGFRRVRNFDIQGQKTGLFSEVMASECGSVIIPLNESKDDISQIAEFLREYNGEGIQHIALDSSNLYDTVDQLSNNGIPFQDTPETYYELVDRRLPGHGEPVEELRKRRILVDGGKLQGGGYLLQIFTKNSIGPIFFEFIQRKGNKGFGEGNFQALFESIELDQERRGVFG